MLAVAVDRHQAVEVAGERFAEGRRQGRTIATVVRMAHHPDVPLTLEAVGKEPRRAVGRAIVDHEDVGRETENLVEDLLDLPDLVEDRQGREELRLPGHRAAPGSVGHFWTAGGSRGGRHHGSFLAGLAGTGWAVSGRKTSGHPGPDVP